MPLPRAAFLAFALAIASACVEVDGGAVEVSWVVRSPDGRAITDCGCSDPRIVTVQIDLRGTAGGQPCLGLGECGFPCQRQTGATPFRIPPGTYAVSVAALGLEGEPLPAVLAPAPILRDVIAGQATELESFLLVARCADNCSGMNGSGVCTSQ